jgi:type III pantothenate kinase
VLDVGNTSMKWGFYQDGILNSKGRDGSLWHQKNRPKYVYFASVRSDDQNQRLLSEIQAYFDGAILFPLSVEQRACQVVNAYTEPKRLGIDRWLGVLAAYHHFQSDLVLVDAGTALKVDVVAANGQHEGGYIVPGMALMESSLIDNTGRIRFSEKDMCHKEGLPDNTGLAVRLGCEEMTLGYLERIYRRYSKHRWCFTGGAGAQIMKALNIPQAVFDEDLVLKGVKLLGDTKVSSV